MVVVLAESGGGGAVGGGDDKRKGVKWLLYQLPPLMCVLTIKFFFF